MGVGDGEGELVAGSETGGSRGGRKCGPNFVCLPNRHSLSSTKYGVVPVVRVQPGALQAVDSSIIR